MEAEDLYIKKPSGFSYEVDDTLISPYIYQPTPEGVKILCTHYSGKYSIDLRCLELEGKVDNPDNSLNLIKHLDTVQCVNALPMDNLTGIILSHGQHHVIPLLVSKSRQGTKIVVFDSTSEERIRGYFDIANLFPEATLYLNAGTRQVDSSSCMTDAICILKEAMQLKTLFSLLTAKRNTTDHRLLKKTNRFFNMPASPENFILFNMPEQLLLTAQSSAYVESTLPDYSTLLRGEASLADYRTHFRMQVSLTQGSSTTVKGINSYLFKKAQEHRTLFDCHIKEFNKALDLELPEVGLSVTPQRSVQVDTRQAAAEEVTFRDVTSPRQFA